MVMHLDVGREKSIKALEDAMMKDHHILLATQKETSLDEPTKDDLYQTGTVAEIKQMVKLPNGTRRILIEGLHRAEVQAFNKEDDFFIVEYESLDDEQGENLEQQAMMRMLINDFMNSLKYQRS
ncbi:LON peptidase substrate-binding domain-containing protein [Piscibacillus salipiscarius]|uniref:LON peptidase substrate-binding domain-containing protein n=1 Tax=Piscibacillus salipiscarius TaxID=299480 RepID=UPI003F6FFD76